MIPPGPRTSASVTRPLASKGVDRSPQLVYSITRKSGDDIGWWRDQIQGLDVLSCRDSMHVNEPKVRARNIIVWPAISSNVSSRERTPPVSPEVSMFIPAWLWGGWEIVLYRFEKNVFSTVVLYAFINLI